MSCKWGPVLRCAVAAGFGGLAVAGAVLGAPWPLAAIVAVVACMFGLGRRRIFRAAVTRTADDEIVCRFDPWLEGDAYLVNVLLPLMGIAALTAGYTPGNPVWLRYVGYLFVGLLPLFAYGTYNRWRQSLVRITPSTVALRVLTTRMQDPVILPRERIDSITVTTGRVGSSGTFLQVEVGYRDPHAVGDTGVMALGKDLTVTPVNLYHALVRWRDAGGDHTSALMDDVEEILRTGPTTDPA